MDGAASGGMGDLVAAAGAGGDDDCLVRRGPNGREQDSLAVAQRQVVVLALVAEGAGHTAAATVDLAGLQSAGPQHGERRGSGGQRLVVAVAVQEGGTGRLVGG